MCHSSSPHSTGDSMGDPAEGAVGMLSGTCDATAVV